MQRADRHARITQERVLAMTVATDNIIVIFSSSTAPGCLYESTEDIIVIFSFDIAPGGMYESTNDKTVQAHTTNPPRSGRAPRKYIYIKNNSFARGLNASLYPNPSPRAATKRLHLKGEIGTPASPHAVIAGEMPHAKKNLQGVHCC